MKTVHSVTRYSDNTRSVGTGSFEEQKHSSGAGPMDGYANIGAKQQPLRKSYRHVDWKSESECLR